MFNYYLFLLDYFFSLNNLCISLFYNFFYYFKKSNTSKLLTTSYIHCIMNGSSLNENVYELNKLNRHNHKFAVSNFFLNSNLYEILKPDYYFLSDPLFFKSNNTLINSFYKKMFNDTKWPLTLIIDAKHFNFSELNILKKNNNITLYTYKYIPLHFGNFKFNKFLFNNFNSSPLFQNVLVSMLTFFVKNDNKNIFIWGANHDWFLNYKLDRNNKLFLIDHHFYETNNNLITLQENNNNLFYQFRNLSFLHYSYSFLAYISKSKKITIINMNENSWIDSFEKFQFR